jgi:hypothetical protein
MRTERDTYRLTCPECGHSGELLWEEDERGPLHGGEFTGFSYGRVARSSAKDKVFGTCQECGHNGELISVLR